MHDFQTLCYGGHPFTELHHLHFSWDKQPFNPCFNGKVSPSVCFLTKVFLGLLKATESLSSQVLH